jgi:hypothetical protein
MVPSETMDCSDRPEINCLNYDPAFKIHTIIILKWDERVKIYSTLWKHEHEIN